MNFMLFSMARVYIREQKNTKIFSNYLEDFYNEQDINFILFFMERVYILEQKKNIVQLFRGLLQWTGQPKLLPWRVIK